MRTLVFLSLFTAGIVCCFPVAAQTSPGKVDLQSYVGTWKYETPVETLIFKLKDTIKSSTIFEGEFYHKIIGTYRYIKNGIVVIDNMNMFPCVDDLGMPVIARPGREDAVGNIHELSLSFKDTKTGKSSSDCIIEYVSPGSSEKKIRLILKDETDLLVWESLGQGLDPEYDEYMKKKKLPGWTIPNNVVLIKQE